MANWRKQEDASRHQVGQWNRSYSGKPPLDRWQATVPVWEKKFCAVIGSVPWPKVVETKKYIYLHDNVVKWDDSAGKEAFDNAKKKFWAEINGLPCDLSLPDPEMHIDNVDWNSTVDPELILDLEREQAPGDKTNDEVVILDGSHLLDPSFFCTGWGEAEAIVPTGWGEDEISPTGRREADTQQPPVWGDSDVNVHSQADKCTGYGDPSLNVNSGLLQGNIPVPPPTGWGDPNPNVNSGVTGCRPNVNSGVTGCREPETNLPKDNHFPPPQGWDSDLNAYGGVNCSTGWGEADTGEGSWEQYCVPQEPAKVSEWVNQENDSWRWKDGQQIGFQKTGKGRGSGNWGSFDGGNKRREKVAFRQQSGFRTSACHGNENQMGGRGRRNNRGRRGGFAYGRSYGDNMVTGRWEVRTK
ncbi:uncharacterized protein LOC114724457 isoform X2 [Neltuma alba]|uniref:uncharacterized protein LOC114724457 isoform X2 n=1 Tax=Neltuma alba TaxID=207710 RepID=UPI0010A426AE|nr:uncharacterized protein LOC114724457 isoform X2 [Prosopis alba]